MADGGVARRPVVLVVEDTPSTRALVRRTLESAGFAVDEAPDGRTAREKLAGSHPDVVVLDVELPDVSGLDLMMEVTALAVPVLLLTARADEVDRVLGLELGAEDYVVKPFYARELAARVRGAVRRRTDRPSPSLRYRDLTIDVAARELRLGGALIELTRREFDLLTYLASAPRTAFTRDRLLREVWRSSSDWQSVRTVNEHVRRLRSKIEEDPRRPRRIVTVPGVGYRFEP